MTINSTSLSDTTSDFKVPLHNKKLNPIADAFFKHFEITEASSKDRLELKIKSAYISGHSFEHSLKELIKTGLVNNITIALDFQRTVFPDENILGIILPPEKKRENSAPVNIKWELINLDSAGIEKLKGYSYKESELFEYCDKHPHFRVNNNAHHTKDPRTKSDWYNNILKELNKEQVKSTENLSSYSFSSSRQRLNLSELIVKSDQDKGHITLPSERILPDQISELIQHVLVKNLTVTIDTRNNPMARDHFQRLKIGMLKNFNVT